MTDDKIEGIARELLGHREQGTAIAAGTAREAPADVAEAYAVQEAMERLLTVGGARAIGYKIGATNEAARTMLKADGPFRGRLYDVSTSASGATVARRASLYRAWEAEIAVLLGEDLPAGGAPYTAADIEAATRAILPAIEIVGTVFDPWTEAGLGNLVSDNAVHGHWITGAEVTDWSGLDLMELPVDLVLDGEVAISGKGANVDGGPFGSTAALANALAAEGRGLKAGEYVTTGTVTPPVPVGPHSDIAADFGALGVVRLTLAG